MHAIMPPSPLSPRRALPPYPPVPQTARARLPHRAANALRWRCAALTSLRRAHQTTTTVTSSPTAPPNKLRPAIPAKPVVTPAARRITMQGNGYLVHELGGKPSAQAQNCTEAAADRGRRYSRCTRSIPAQIAGLRGAWSRRRYVTTPHRMHAVQSPINRRFRAVRRANSRRVSAVEARQVRSAPPRLYARAITERQRREPRVCVRARARPATRRSGPPASRLDGAHAVEVDPWAKIRARGLASMPSERWPHRTSVVWIFLPARKPRRPPPRALVRCGSAANQV